MIQNPGDKIAVSPPIPGHPGAIRFGWLHTGMKQVEHFLVIACVVFYVGGSFKMELKNGFFYSFFILCPYLVFSQSAASYKR